MSNRARFAGLVATALLHMVVVFWLFWRPASAPPEMPPRVTVTRLMLLAPSPSSRSNRATPPSVRNVSIAAPVLTPTHTIDLLPVLRVAAEPIVSPTISQVLAAAPSVDFTPPGQDASVIATDCMPLRWLQDMSRMISFQLRYPARSRQLGERGTVTVRVSLTRDGKVMEAPLLRPTGYRALDKEALAVIQRIGRFMPIPASACRGARIVVIDQPIAFGIGGR